MPKRTQPSSAPSDYARISDYYDENLRLLFSTYRSFEHHLEPVRPALEDAEVLVRIGKLLYVHRTRFWPAFQQAHVQMTQKRAAGLLQPARKPQRTKPESQPVAITAE
jgi:hypothetical protein